MGRASGPAPRSTIETATSLPGTYFSTSAVESYAKQPTIAAGRSVSSRTTAAPRPEPPWAGFTINGRPSRSTIRSSTATAPSSEKRSCGSATQSGVGMPASRSIDLADGLSQASREARASQPTYGTPHRSSTPRSEPSSPVAPCRAITTADGGSSWRYGNSDTSASRIVASIPAPRSASSTRRPDFNDTSRSYDKPPARTSTSTTSGERPTAGASSTAGTATDEPAEEASEEAAEEASEEAAEEASEEAAEEASEEAAEEASEE